MFLIVRRRYLNIKTCDEVLLRYTSLNSAALSAKITKKDLIILVLTLFVLLTGWLLFLKRNRAYSLMQYLESIMIVQ